MNLKKKFYSGRGFTIVEVLIATTIVGTVLAGLMALLGGAVKSSSQVNNALVASMLAQEGIELIINIRDTNWVEAVAYDDGLGHSSAFKQQAGIINYNENAITYIQSNNILDGAGTCQANDIDSLFQCTGTKLYLNPSGFYTHSIAVNETPYRRAIQVIRESDSLSRPRLKVISTVRWGEPTNQGKQVSLTTFLYDWMP